MSNFAGSNRPRVVIVTTHWGDAEDEMSLATRLVAGALALTADVDVVHVCADGADVTFARNIADSVFTVHRVRQHGAMTLRSGVVRAALADHHGGRLFPPAAAALLEHYEGRAPEVPEVVAGLHPDAIVLAGYHQPYELDEILDRVTERPKIVFLPFTTDEATLRTVSIRHLISLCDAIGIAHYGERTALVEAEITFDDKAIVPLDLAFPINRSGTTQGLFGVRFFGLYVLLIRGFPPNGARHGRAVTHEVLRTVLDSVSVAEVDGDKWRISDRENTLEFPVNPSRVNLWRLMAHAVVTVDMRPPGPIGREAIESMLLGTPVVVPDHSAAMHHVKAANGGLWYRDVGELFDCTRALMSARVRSRLAAQGRDYAERHHGQMDDFARRMAVLVLGDRY